MQDVVTLCRKHFLFTRPLPFKRESSFVCSFSGAICSDRADVLLPYIGPQRLQWFPSPPLRPPSPVTLLTLLTPIPPLPRYTSHSPYPDTPVIPLPLSRSPLSLPLPRYPSYLLTPLTPLPLPYPYPRYPPLLCCPSGPRNRRYARYPPYPPTPPHPCTLFIPLLPSRPYAYPYNPPPPTCPGLFH